MSLGENRALLAYGLLIGFALQALISEFLGVDANTDGIAVPNYPIPGFSLLPLWRKTIPRQHFDRIDRHGPVSATVFVSGAPMNVRLPSHKEQSLFLRYCVKAYPEKFISR